ncbi:c-type cytochrome [Massilia violaceinigra]|uniref:C-type cytochrome n=1 Tax=Massilia violaceinigra TaxID=2045208 RepID=A0ABY4A210_9BURK|nr:c-type cytochrome [Massilia violaceinigra]UOD28200.1 c-type cytochrome [Massilia violaceinigra]
MRNTLTRALVLGALAFGTLAAAPLHAAERPAVLPDTMSQRLLACASCHAKKDVNDAYFPRISGKPAGYLYNQLLNFREGRRQYPLMTYMVDHLPDAYLHEIAAHFAAEHLPPPPPQATSSTPAVLARGRQLALQGDPALKVPACIACHGDKLTGVSPAIPGLAGLPRDYINAQFGAWRTKTRRTHAPDCMAVITERLSLEDVNAVSSWLGTQQVAPEARPAATIARPLPINCGSAPD